MKIAATWRRFVMVGDVLDIEMGNNKAFLGIGK